MSRSKSEKMDFLNTVGAAGFPEGASDAYIVQILATFLYRNVISDVDFDTELGMVLTQVIEESWSEYEDWLRDPNWE